MFLFMCAFPLLWGHFAPSRTTLALKIRHICQNSTFHVWPKMENRLLTENEPTDPKTNDTVRSGSLRQTFWCIICLSSSTYVEASQLFIESLQSRIFSPLDNAKQTSLFHSLRSLQYGANFKNLLGRTNANSTTFYR